MKSSSTQLLPANSVLMSSRAPIGYLAISLCEMTTNQGFKSIVPDVSEMAEFILWSLDALMDGIKERSSGTTFKEISGSEFGKTLVPIAPLGEQVRIVKALGSSLSCL
ncbi:MAG: restriction endonuclease subunit S [Collinsella sp.]